MPSRPSTGRRIRSSRPALARHDRRVRHDTRPWKLTSSSVQATDRLGHAIGCGLQGGETVTLVGPLGAGKTALVRGIARGLEAGTASVSSPTFVFIHEYRGRLLLAHVDLYRIGSAVELDSTGLSDYLSGKTVTAIEWADKGRAWLPHDRLEIELRHRTVKSRTIRLTARGPVSAALLSRTRSAFDRQPPSGRRRRPKSRKASPA